MSKIKHVFGNVLRLAIPLTLKTVTVTNGTSSETETDFCPNTDYPVQVVMRKGVAKFIFTGTVEDNVVSIEDAGTLPVGVYQVEVICRNDDAEPMRYMVRSIVEICDATIDAGIEEGVEFNSEQYILEGAVFIAFTGSEGGTTYTAGDGINIENGVISANGVASVSNETLTIL